MSATNKHSGLLFDVLAIFTGLIMFTQVKDYFYRNYKDTGALHWETALFISIGVLCYTIGLWLYKNNFLQTITKVNTNKHRFVQQMVLLVLVLMHIAIFSVLAFVMAESWHVLLPQNLMRFVCFGVIGGLPNLILLWTLFQYQNRRAKFTTNSVSKTVGSILLALSAVFIQLLFWNVMTIPMLQNLQVDSFLGRIMFAGLFFVLFLLIYLPLRLFFFMLDYQYARTWIQILLAYLPTAVYIIMS
jgi:hypothetical protein